MRSNIARQAIYNAEQQIIAYELLFRDGQCDVFPCVPSEWATQSVLNDVYTNRQDSAEQISGGLPCFVNFSHQSLIDGIAFQYPAQDLIIEVLEDCSADTALYQALLLHKSRGYKIALDDFIPTSEWLPFLDLVDIVKIDFRAQTLEQIARFVGKFRPKFHFELLAEKIETEEEYRIAKALGFDFFQGYQLSKPERVFVPNVA
ncbi:EAL and HDOD domain-containing protein [Enterovibrio paralichthyis]|uniref:EAL and HDOD domain-containing protein n=1 Tax=Enterovibrio paralichthyis TaxID=2853805 RepID=UPI001C471323|nr:EAL domain-containing protein [Enterovibrio paralichthyis]MBV7299491.1 EAL domain-containing protein [Enterovibrio paralichthyis]